MVFIFLAVSLAVPLPSREPLHADACLMGNRCSRSLPASEDRGPTVVTPVSPQVLPSLMKGGHWGLLPVVKTRFLWPAEELGAAESAEL